MKAETEAGWYTFFIVIGITAIVGSLIALGFGYWIPVVVLAALFVLLVVAVGIGSLYESVLREVKHDRKHQ